MVGLPTLISAATVVGVSVVSYCVLISDVLIQLQAVDIHQYCYKTQLPLIYISIFCEPSVVTQYIISTEYCISDYQLTHTDKLQMLMHNPHQFPDTSTFCH